MAEPAHRLGHGLRRSAVLLVCALTATFAVTATGQALTKWTAGGAGAVRAKARTLGQPPAPTVRPGFALLGCLVTLSVRVSWGTPPPGTEYEIHNNNVRQAGPFRQAGEQVFGNLSILGIGADGFYLVARSGQWFATGPVARCG